MFEFEKCGKSEAQEFWERNSLRTQFTKPEVLEHFSANIEWWLLKKGNEPFAIWPICLDDSNRVFTPNFTYFVGPFWSDVAQSRPVSSRYSDRLSGLEVAVSKLFSCYQNLEFELSPLDLDVRFFSWWNYGVENGPHFEITPRYSARIPNLRELDEDRLIEGFRELRRRELRKVRKNGLFEKATDATWLEIEEIYREVFERQGAATKDYSNVLRPLQSLYERGLLTLIGFRHVESGLLAAATGMLIGEGESHLILNATRSQFLNSGIASEVMLSSLLESKRQGARYFDFNGANSPNRGGDKHSYGAEATLFFRLAITKGEGE